LEPWKKSATDGVTGDWSQERSAIYQSLYETS